MPDFSTRSTRAEKMDDPAAPEEALRQNLRELEVVNQLLGGYSVVLNALNSLSLPTNKKVRMADMGCGGGDMLRAIAKWAARKQVDVQLSGIDLNPIMIAYAKEHSAGFNNIGFLQRNVMDEALAHKHFDIVVCSLFCHHFPHGALVPLVKKMYGIAQKAVIINDLHRHWFAWYSIRLLTAIFSKTDMVKHDAPLSVERAFSRKDLEQVMKEAGISQYTLKWKWAWRWELIIRKPETRS